LGGTKTTIRWSKVKIYYREPEGKPVVNEASTDLSTASHNGDENGMIDHS
jgi:hypothetical protein